MEVSLLSFNHNMPTLREVIEFMGEKGDEAYDIPGYLRLRRPFDGALAQVYLAFAKCDGVFHQSNNFDKII